MDVAFRPDNAPELEAQAVPTGPTPCAGPATAVCDLGFAFALCEAFRADRMNLQLRSPSSCLLSKRKGFLHVF